MEKTILLLEKRGCDFFLNSKDKEDQELFARSDLQNYRLFFRGVQYKRNLTKGEKKSSLLLGDLQHCYLDRTGKKWKKYYGLYLDLSFEDSKGTWRPLDLEKQILDKKYIYHSEDVIKAFNDFSKYKINKIIITDNVYNEIEKQYGYREKEILENCKKTTEVMNTKDHHVIKFYDLKNNYFLYDLKTNTIVG